jgi:hypothetical protein
MAFTGLIKEARIERIDTASQMSNIKPWMLQIVSLIGYIKAKDK